MALSKGFELAKLGSGLDVNQSTGEVVAISMDTDVVSEGTTNIYFTDARVDNRVASLLAGGTTGNIVTTGYIAGPATFTIDPAGVGDNTGTVVIAGNLQVDGTQTTINSTTLDVDDLNITVASGAADSAAANGAGLTVDGAGANITYTHATTSWDFNKDINVTGTTTTDQYLYVNSPNGTQLQLRSEDAYTTLAAGNRNLNISANRTIFLDDAFAEVMRINDDGNVGIGTAAPSHPLHVAGNIAFENGDGLISKNVAGSTRTLLTLDTTNRLRIKGNAPEAVDSEIGLTLIDNGNVGIGILAPVTALHVRGTASAVGATRSVVTLTDDTAMGINVGSGVAFRGLYTSAGAEANYGGIFAGKSNANSGNANGYLSLSYSASGTLTEGIRISETGNVGIGTSSPDAILDIEGNFETNYALKFTNTQGTGKVSGFRSHGTNGNDLTIYQDGARKQGWSSSEVKFYGTSNAEVMRIQNDGNVGIGTTNPTVRTGMGLVINGGANQARLALKNDSTGDSSTDGFQIVVTSGSGSDGGQAILEQRENNIIAFKTNGSEAMRILPSGNVGIGTSTFGTNGKLQVAGGIGLSGNSEIRQSTNSDGSTLRFLGTQFVAGAANSHSYSYTGGALIAARAAHASALLFDVGASSTSGHKLKVLNDGNGIAGSLQYLNGSDTRFIVKSSTGNVGIGTATPSTKLDISTSGDDGITLNADTVTATASSRLFFNNGTAGKAVGLFNSYNALRFTVLATPGTSTGTEKMRLTEAGFLSLGGHSPATVLDIANVGGAHGLALNADANNATLSSRLFLNNGTAGKAISIMNNGNDLSISTAATPGSGSGSEKVRILENGNVGIGTSSPSQKLDVAGNIALSGTVDGVDIAARDGVLTSTTTTANAALPKAGGAMTGDVSFTNGNKAVFGGTGNGELEIYAHATNNNVYISENAAGNLNLGADNFNIYTNAFTKQVASFTAGSAKLLNDGNEKLATTATGIDVTGNVSLADGGKATFGTGDDLQIYHTGGTSVINDVGTGRLFIGGSPGVDIGAPEIDEYYIRAHNDGAVELYYDNAKKLETTATGIDVTGNANFANNGKAIFGASNNLQIFSTGTSSYVAESGSGDLYIKGSSIYLTDTDNNQYIHLSDTGTGGTVVLKHNAVSKLATTATGIDVTGNITVSGYIAGPAVLTIDPAGVGDNTGKVVIAGDLQIDGTTTTINSTTLTVDDLNITLASGAADSAAANGAGITVDGANATITYDGTNDEWDFNKDVNVTGNIALSGTVDGVDIAARDGVLTSTTTTANAALPKAGGAMTGAITTNSTFDGRNVSVDGDKLDLIEAGATADQTAAQLLTAIKTVDGTGSGLDADLLDGQQGSYYYSSGNPPPLTADPTLTLTGDATGSATFTNLGNATLTVAIADDSHNHTLANIDQVTINNTNDLDTYNTRGLYNWSSSNPANSPAAYGSMLVLPDGSREQQLLQTYGGAANSVSLYGRRKTSGTWDTTWTQYFSDHYHPNADTLTTARNINGVAFNGSIDITVADATKLPLAGGTLTGNLAISNTTPVLSINDTNNGSGGGFIGHIEFNNTSGESFRIGDWAAVDETSTGGPDVLRLRNSNGTRTVFEWGQAGTTAGSLYAYNQRVFADDYHPNADTLTTARNINGVAFDGSIDITVADATKLPLAGGTMTGELQVNARLDVGDGTSGDTEIRIYKADNNISDHIQFYNGTTRMGEIGCHDTTWLRINQSTSKNIYTPRYIRADAGFFVDSTAKGINGSGNFIGGTITGASDANVSNWDTAYTTANAALPKAGGTMTGGLTINENGDSLHLRNTTNGGSVGVSFSSNVPAGQIGHLRFSHSDTGSYGSGAAFVLGSTESTTTILADGKLMFDEGIYSKPATGTGAGTRKDSNWDTAYTTANAALPKAGGTMTGPLIVDTDNNANGGLRLLVNQTNPQQDFYFAQEIVSTLSGATVTTSDREQGGIWIDLNSTATGGGTSHEHRVYGAYLDVDSTGDADMVYGVYSDATVTPSTGQTSQVTGGYFRAEDNGGAGAVSSVFGVQGQAHSDNATSDTNTLIGGYFKTTNAADTGNVTTASAVYGEIEIAAGTGDHYGTSHVFQAQYDNNDTVAQTNTTYLYYGNYAGVLPTTAYGVYIADAVTSYFGGTIRSAGDVVAYYSDERLKDFHGTIPNAMDKVKQLNGYYFTENQLAKDLGYNNDSTQVGVSAQEVEAVLPEIVKEAAINTEKGTDYKTVQYEKLTALLIEAVKEQQTEIDELKKLVKDLMSR